MKPERNIFLRTKGVRQTDAGPASLHIVLPLRQPHNEMGAEVLTDRGSDEAAILERDVPSNGLLAVPEPTRRRSHRTERGVGRYSGAESAAGSLIRSPDQSVDFLIEGSEASCG